MSARRRGAVRGAAAVAGLLLAASALAGCSVPGAGQTVTPSGSGTRVSGTITVFAAASLTKTFTELGTEFEAAHPGTTVTFSFAGSSDLVTQLTAGAPADVFASADEANMTKAVAGKVIQGTPTDFATNVLAIAVPPGNPAHVKSFADLASPGIKTVVCAPQVPCGAATAKVEQSAGVTLHPVSQESSVTDVLGKVSSGEADAGIVYRTDVKGAGSSVESVPFPEAAKTVNVYPIASVAHAPNPRGGAAFVAFATGPEGRHVLAAAGFGAP
ncbi:molybdate ABC transporter substrate-binding protein [Leifsonia shinshuensis]|uniref:molybdate ABC transporter substrate-binding protein n=1 Tax=Leifsonia shinshuensis TaxID=150026 RepID=UPI002858C6BB|nr:molybdate ABC transporter substrate-binding protein [Leifsonia shinshuensis]MDR6969982.1 molybdate transport system substrate-binding protein [Leifsonia shinshuensis]